MRAAGLLFALLIPCLVWAQDLYMIRSSQAFPEAMTTLQEAVKAQGYTVSRVQRVDIGLTASGYQTDKYRVVFFGKLSAISDLSASQPALAAYLPLKIAIFAEGEETILLASGFRHLRPTFTDPGLVARFDRWEEDIQAILERVRITQ